MKRLRLVLTILVFGFAARALALYIYFLNNQEAAADNQIITQATTPIDKVSPNKSTGADWSLGSPEAVGIDSAQLAGIVPLIHDGSYPNVHAILVIRAGRLVFEHYFDGYTCDYMEVYSTCGQLIMCIIML